MITSADVRDYMDGLLREMREIHGEWVVMEAHGAFYTSEQSPDIVWRCFGAGTSHSPSCETAEDCVGWFKRECSNAVESLKQKASELQAEAERLLAKAAELESQTATTNEAKS